MKEVNEDLNSALLKKAASKLPQIFANETATLPDSSVVEQASGELTATYVASFVGEGDTVADLTGGLGVNSYHFSQRAKKVFCIEIDEKRAEALKHNFEEAGVKNIEVIHSDAIEWLKKTANSFDFVYVDPSRRSQHNNKIITLSESSPDLTQILPLLKDRTKRLVVKASPLLDLTSILKEFSPVSGIMILEAQREVKELLIDFNFKESSDETKPSPYLKCVKLNSKGRPETMEFKISDSEKNSANSYIPESKTIEIGGFLYEPSPSIMKSGMFGSICETYPDLMKLDPNTHLFYSKIKYENFPGRIFTVDGLPGSKELKRMKGGNYNVISRNHPCKAPELEQRYRFKGSDERFVIACKASGKNIILIASKCE